MNVELRRIQKNPKDKSALLQLEVYIKKNWKFFVPDKKYDSFCFGEAFSELLLFISANSESLTKKSVTNTFRTSYEKIFKKLNETVLVSECSIQAEEEVVKTSKLVFENFSNSDYIILFKYLNNPDLPKSKKVINLLSRVRLKSDINDGNLSELLSNCNFISLYLINELGIKKYKEMTELMDNFGIYYPVSKVPDNEAVLNVKDAILHKFTESLSNVKLTDLTVLENLIFK